MEGEEGEQEDPTFEWYEQYYPEFLDWVREEISTNSIELTGFRNPGRFRVIEKFFENFCLYVFGFPYQSSLNRLFIGLKKKSRSILRDIQNTLNSIAIMEKQDLENKKSRPLEWERVKWSPTASRLFFGHLEMSRLHVETRWSDYEALQLKIKYFHNVFPPLKFQGDQSEGWFKQKSSKQYSFPIPRSIDIGKQTKTLTEERDKTFSSDVFTNIDRAYKFILFKVNLNRVPDTNWLEDLRTRLEETSSPETKKNPRLEDFLMSGLYVSVLYRLNDAILEFQRVLALRTQILYLYVDEIIRNDDTFKRMVKRPLYLESENIRKDIRSMNKSLETDMKMIAPGMRNQHVQSLRERIELQKEKKAKIAEERKYIDSISIDDLRNEYEIRVQTELMSEVKDLITKYTLAYTELDEAFNQLQIMKRNYPVGDKNLSDPNLGELEYWEIIVGQIDKRVWEDKEWYRARENNWFEIFENLSEARNRRTMRRRKRRAEIEKKRYETESQKRARLLKPYAIEGKRTYRISGLEDTMSAMSIYGKNDDDAIFVF
jgi:hypothetical protein